MSTQSAPAVSAGTPETVALTTQAVKDLTLGQDTPEANELDGDGEQDEEGDEHADAVNEAGSSSAAAKKKKKKSKSKGKGKVIDKLKALGGGSNKDSAATTVEDAGPSSSSSSVATRKQPPAITEELYQRIIAEASKNVGPGEAAKLTRQDVAEMVETLKLRDVMSGKSSGVDSTGRNKKDMADHKFWSTQPVPKLGSLSNITPEGAIEKDKPQEQIRQEPYPLPKDFEWVTMDLDDPVQLKEVYDLLTANYVEDNDATFRFDYSAEFIRWALQPPGFIKDWHIGVRVSASRRLVAFISGIPFNTRVRQVTKASTEINFLCVHKKLRSKRLAPVLISEVTRRCNIRGIFQAVYTVGVFLPTPISACQYYHRAVNTKKLVDTGFSGVPRSTTLARLITKNRVPATPSLPGLREIQEKDLKQVGELLHAYLSRFDLAPVMSEEEIRHNFWSGRGKGELDPSTNRREEQVTWTYVVEDPESGRITDFFCFYSLPSTAIKITPNQTIDAAYLFYYATSECPTCSALLPNGSASQGSSTVPTWDKENEKERAALKKRLNLLMADMLVMANRAKFDVVNALTLMDNNLFLADQKFGAGDGFLHYYLYNYSTRPIAGGCVDPAQAAAGVRSQPRGQGEFDPAKGSGIGLVML